MTRNLRQLLEGNDWVPRFAPLSNLRVPGFAFATTTLKRAEPVRQPEMLFLIIAAPPMLQIFNHALSPLIAR